jgi:hypothetical protein
MSRIQHTIVRGQSSNANARRLLAGMGKQAPHVAAQTVLDLRIDARELVVECIADEALVVGKVRVAVGQTYYLAAGKTAHTYYVVVQDVSGEWRCSYDGSSPRFVNMVKRYIVAVSEAA